MLPRYENTAIPHVSVSVALLNVIKGTNYRTNQFHPSKDSLALDSSELVSEAKSLFGNAVDTTLEVVSKIDMSHCSVQGKANLVENTLKQVIDYNIYR